MKKKLFVLLLSIISIVCLAFGVSACSTTKTDDIAVTSVSISSTEISLEVGESYTLSATISPSNATNTSVTWSSSAASVATVSGGGEVTAVSEGTAVITVTTTDGGYTDTCTVTVTETQETPTTVSVTSVSLSENSLSLEAGGTYTLTATVLPSNATDKTVSWSCSDESVATVNNGVITAVAAGTATITVTTTDGNYTATCELTVAETPAEPEEPATVAVTSVALDKSTLDSTVDDTYTLTATILPNNATNQNVTWASSDKSVATVSNGLVTAVSAGTATITVTTEDGNFTDTCTVTVEETSTHIHNYTSVVTAPTCTEQGYTTYTCECGDSYVADYIDAIGHTNAEAVTENYIAATCTTDGSYDLVVYCSVCGAEISRETITVPATGHTNAETVTENEVAATCTTDGSYDLVVCCSVCHEEISSEHITILATGHDYESVVITPTCTEKGYTTHTCSVCGDTYIDNYVDATGHSWNDGEVTTEPTCTETGVKTYTCTACGETETETIAAKGHTEAEAVTENEVAATCVGDGSYDLVVYCSVCGAELSRETITIPATGHTAAEAVIENYVAETDTENGSYDLVVYCSVCGEEISRETVVIYAILVTLSDTAIEIEKGDTYTLTATVTSNGVTSSDVSWVSSNKNVVTVVNGELTAVSTGIATITATSADGKHTATCVITVTAVKAEITNVDGGTINGTSIYMLVDSSKKTLSLSSLVTCSDNCGWKLYDENDGKNAIETKITNTLTDGYNTYYIVVTSTKDTTVSDTYTLTIYKSFEITISYYNGTSVINTDTAYTGYEFTTNYTPDITGYTFNYWKTSDDQAYSAAIIYANLSLYADTTVNTYIVTYDANGGSVNETQITVTYDSSYTFEVPARDGYTFNGWYYGETQLTNESGGSLSIWNYAEDITAIANWAVNYYSVTIEISNGSAGSVTSGGTYAYNTEISISTVDFNHIGYTWVGWYKNNELYTTEYSFLYTILSEDVVFTAKYEVDSELSNFEFTSTTTTCEITGIKDNTVTEIVVPDYVTSISEGAFSNCISLTDVTIGDNITYIGSHAFDGCTSLASVTFANTDGWYVFDSSTATSGTVVDLADASKNATYLTGTYSDYYWYRHAYVATVTEPTCTEQGYTTYTCSHCGDSYISDYTEAKGHTEGETVKENEVAATCTEDGSYDSVVYCSVCGEELSRETVTVSAGHTESEAVIENEVAATCTEDGSYDSVVYCSVCGAEISRETVTIPATGHTARGAVTENYVTATCTTNGSYDLVVYCSVCGAELSRETVTIPATGHTASEAVKENEIAATCTEDGSYDSVVYCSICGVELSRETVTIPAMGHIEGEAVIENEIAATAKEDGSYDSVVYCSVCGEELSRETIIVKATGGVGLSYTLSDDETYYIVSGIGDCTDTEIVIPETYSNLPVQEIAASAFYKSTTITSVVIPDSVTTVGRYAFNGCSSLTGITIGENVISIGERAFTNCTVLETIIFNAEAMENLSSDNYVFSKAGQSRNGITVTIGANVTKIPANLFYPTISSSGTYRPYITSVIFEKDSVCTSIGQSAFCYCSVLESITIPASVTNIEKDAFAYCTSLASVTFETTDGWYYATEGATSGTTLDLTDSTIAATYLRSTYVTYYWYRKQS